MSNINGKWQQQNTWDAIVVGSGISGGWAAKELCEKGLRTLVLERGRMVRHIADYPTMHLNPWNLKYGDMVSREETEKFYPKQNRSEGNIRQSWKHWFVKDNEHPYAEVKPFDWLRGYQVGGRSIAWGRQCYRWCDLDFEANAREGIAIDWPVRYHDLAPWYDYVENWIGVSGSFEGLSYLPDGKFQPPMPFNCLETKVKSVLERTFPGRKMIIGRTANLTQPSDLHEKLGRGKCQFRNLCVRGCPYGAYFSSNSATLVAAELTGNLTLRPHSIVHSILYDPEKRRAKGVKVLDAQTRQELEFYARVIFLNASAFNTAWILMNSANVHFPSGLGNSSDQLGRNVMDHHLELGAFATSEEFSHLYHSGRRPNGIYIPRFRNLDTGTRSKDFLRGYGYQGGASREGWYRMVAEFGIGKTFKEKLSQPGLWTMGIYGFGEMLPHPDNRITLNTNLTDMYSMPTLNMDVALRENEMTMRRDMLQSALEMLDAVGLKNVKPYDPGYTPGAGIHEMGTARMGHDPKTSVLNRWNQMHDVKNIFITDGACMTSSSCVNPSLTYMALTARACDYAVRELKKMNL